MHWKVILILTSGIGFCTGSAAYILVKIVLRPKDGQDWEQEHWELEDQNPLIKRYHFWCRVLFATIVISMLLMFISISV